MFKIAFFDVDGTLLGEATDFLIPQDTQDALIELRRRGVKLCIASGRPPFDLPPCVREGFPGLEGGFDAYVTLTGTYCIDANGPYYQEPHSPEFVRRFVDCVERGEFDSLMITTEASFCNDRSESIAAVERALGLSYTVADFRTESTVPVYQVVPAVPPERDAELPSLLGPCAVTRWHPAFCDIVAAGAGKDRGIQATLEHFGLSRSESIAFGDGGNDVPMLRFCQVGVAMGNGTDEAKAAADHVTGDMDKGGLVDALRRFGLLDAC